MTKVGDNVSSVPDVGRWSGMLSGWSKVEDRGKWADRRGVVMSSSCSLESGTGSEGWPMSVTRTTADKKEATQLSVPIQMAVGTSHFCSAHGVTRVLTTDPNGVSNSCG